MKYPEKTNLWRQRVHLCLPKAGGGWSSAAIWEETANGYRVYFWGDENALKLIVTMVASPGEILKTIELYILNG